MAQQTPLLTMATLSIGVGLRSLNRKLRSLCAAQPRVGHLIFWLPALPAAVTVVSPELSGFQPHRFSFLLPPPDDFHFSLYRPFGFYVFKGYI